MSPIEHRQEPYSSDQEQDLRRLGYGLRVVEPVVHRTGIQISEDRAVIVFDRCIRRTVDLKYVSGLRRWALGRRRKRCASEAGGCRESVQKRHCGERERKHRRASSESSHDPAMITGLRPQPKINIGAVGRAGHNWGRFNRSIPGWPVSGCSPRSPSTAWLLRAERRRAGRTQQPACNILVIFLFTRFGPVGRRSNV